MAFPGIVVWHVVSVGDSSRPMLGLIRGGLTLFRCVAAEANVSAPGEHTDPSQALPGGVAGGDKSTDLH